jgi:lysophospholipase L1-like esterase
MKNTLLRLLIFFLFTGLFLPVRGGHAIDLEIPDNVHRIVFLGNSITYAGSYITDIEAYIITHYPKRRIEFINVGLPSETVSGLSEDGHAGGKFPRPDLHERLERVLAQTKPDLVFACYGMNDGIYMPFDEERFQKFKDGISWLHDEVVKAGARIVHLTPPVYDEVKGGKTGYGTVLDRYTDWLLHQRNAAAWQVADIHYPMKKYLEEHRQADAAFVLASDAIHPGETGHWIMAREILAYLGESDVLNTEDVKAALTSIPNGEKILDLVASRQSFLKDAWLTATRHTRPGMKTGIPLAKAKSDAKKIGRQIQTLMK